MADNAFASRTMRQRSTCDKAFLRPRVRSWHNPKCVFNLEIVLSTEDGWR